MNVASVFGALRRRWYVLVPGMLLAIAAVVMTWITVLPDYERSAAQLLLPARETLPQTSSNPYLFLGGLTSVADVIVRAVGSEDNVRQITEPYPGSDMEVSRDPLSAGPVILITVTAPSDDAAEAMIDAAVARTEEIVVGLQVEQGIAERDQISVTIVSRDGESALQQRGRFTIVATVGLGMSVLTLLVAAVLDGLLRERRRRVDADDPGEESSVDANPGLQRKALVGARRSIDP